jgi:hypothetical protein
MVYARIVLSFSNCSSPSHAMLDHRVHTEWQWPLSCVHYIMVVKSAQPGEGGGVHAHPLSLYLSSRAKLWCMYAPAKKADTLPLFLLYPICTLWLDSSNSLYSKCKSNITMLPYFSLWLIITLPWDNRPLQRLLCQVPYVVTSSKTLFLQPAAGGWFDIFSWKRILHRLFHPAAGGGVDIFSCKRSLFLEALPATAGGGVDIVIFLGTLSDLKRE